MSNEYRVRTALPKYLRVEQERIEKFAKEEGLDFFDTIFEMVSSEQMNEICAKTGFATRYSHWTFGMEYDRMSKQDSWGMGRVYELVINNNPAIAYLQSGNSLTIQRLVIAHVLAHVDFFKNNYCFRSTDLDGGQTTDPLNRPENYNPKRSWVDKMANHGARISRIVDRLGIEKVEQFIDTVLSVENLIDAHGSFSGKRKNVSKEENSKPVKVPRLKTDKEYMINFLNPESYIEEQTKKLEDERAKPKKFPEFAEPDVLGFLLENAPLENWERDVLEVLADEAQYFLPQRQTKIMNEGWATRNHSELLTKKVLDASEIIEFADVNSGVLATNGKSLNPYALGVALYRDIEERWNKGQFGKDWEECTSLSEKANWDTKAGLGKQKIYEVRKLYNDLQFLDTFLTEDFCREHKLFSIAWSNRNERYEIETREFKKVKEKLLFQLTNGGNPFISVEDANHDNRGELLLKHDHQGMDLRQDYAKSVLGSLVRIWKRPASITTVVEEKPVMIRYDGKEHTMRQLRG